MNTNNSYSIIIAESNEIDRILLNAQLESYCKNISLAKNGKELQAYLQQNKYDLILLDIKLPLHSYLDWLKLIKKADSINNNSAIIAITAQAQNSQQDTLLDAGFDQCLIKPILLEQLTKTLSPWLPSPSATTISNEETSLYITAILEKTVGNTELALTIFNKLFSELPQQIQEIESALHSSDLETARQITHKLHGSASFCGFIEMQSKAHDLESSLMENNYESIRPHFFALSSTINQFLVLKDCLLKDLNH